MNKRDSIDYIVIRESNLLLNKAFNRAFAKISRLNLNDIKDAQLINDIIKTEFDQTVIGISDTLYGGVKEQFQASIRKAQSELRSQDSNFRYTFDTTDKAMLDILDEGNSLFMNRLYSSSVEGKVIDSIKTMVTEGKSKKEITDEIASMLSVSGKKAINSITRNVVNTNTLTRSIATANLLEKAGSVKYGYIVVSDNKTSDICKAIKGKTGEVSDLVKTRDDIINIPRTDYDTYVNRLEQVSPMIMGTEKDGFYTQQDANKPFKRIWTKDQVMQIPGVQVPPLHNNCRTELKIIL